MFTCSRPTFHGPVGDLRCARAGPPIGRRTFLAPCGSALVPMCAGAPPHTLPPYCSIDPNVGLARFRARDSTSNSRLDRALIAELRSIMRVMPVNPGFATVDDGGRPNAFAPARLSRPSPPPQIPPPPQVPGGGDDVTSTDDCLNGLGNCQGLYGGAHGR